MARTWPQVHPKALDQSHTTAVLLRSAVNTLSNLDSRRAYDSSGQAVSVSPQQLPGALVLLQESGESQIVIELGSSWLQQHPLDPFAGDVAVAVALALCDQAADEVDAGNGSVVLQACKHLEASLQLLREYKVSVNLQHLIMQILEDYSPRYCIELLRLPLAEMQQRQRGFSLLKKLAFELRPEISPLGKDRDDFLSRARTCMTPVEQLQLYKSLPWRTRQAVQQKLDVALATVAIGFQQHNPRVMQRAALLFKQLQEAATQEGCCLDVSVERAACCLLLGDAQQALQLLGLADGQRAQHAQRSSSQDSVQQFVLEHSADSSDLLPGLYMLTSAWIQEAIVCGFRPEAFDVPAGQDPADLRRWFESRRVQLHIQMLTAVRRFRLFAMLQVVPATIAAFLAWLWRCTMQLFCKQDNSKQSGPNQTISIRWNAASAAETPKTMSSSSRSASPAPASSLLAEDLEASQQLAQSMPQQPGRQEADGRSELLASSPEPASLEVSLRAKLRSRPGTGTDSDDPDKPLRSFTQNRQMQLQACEVEMWDVCTTPAALRQHWAAKVQQALLVVFLGAAAAASVAYSKGRADMPPLPVPARLVAEQLWETARC